MEKGLYKKLMAVQSELKAPKGQFNSFGGYKYRSCEDILESVKPLLKTHGLVLLISDCLESIGDRVYVKANATLSDVDDGSAVSVSAYAREALNKKGMDDSQVTGSASSYARKYALNGLFCIDDTKDADAWDNRKNNVQTAVNARNANSKGNYTKKEENAVKTANTPKTVNDYYELTIEWAKAHKAVTLIGPLMEQHFNKKRFQMLTFNEAQTFYNNLPKMVKQMQDEDDAALMNGVG